MAFSPNAISRRRWTPCLSGLRHSPVRRREGLRGDLAGQPRTAHRRPLPAQDHRLRRGCGFRMGLLHRHGAAQGAARAPQSAAHAARCRRTAPGSPIRRTGGPITSSRQASTPSTATLSARASAGMPGPRRMVEILSVLQGWCGSRDGGIAMSDDNSILTRGELAARVAGLAEEFRDLPQVIGLLGRKRDGLGGRPARRLGGRQDRRAVAHLLQPAAARLRPPRCGYRAISLRQRRLRPRGRARRGSNAHLRPARRRPSPRRPPAPVSSSTHPAAQASPRASASPSSRSTGRREPSPRRPRQASAIFICRSCRSLCCSK